MTTKRNIVKAPLPVPLSLRLTEDEHAALRSIAEQNHRSMTGQIRAWIDAHSSPADDRPPVDREAA